MRPPLFALLALATLSITAGVELPPFPEPEPREPEPNEPPPTQRSAAGSTVPVDVDMHRALPEESVTIVHGPFVPNRDLARRSIERHYGSRLTPDDRRELASAAGKRARKAARRVELARRSSKA